MWVVDHGFFSVINSRPWPSAMGWVSPTSARPLETSRSRKTGEPENTRVTRDLSCENHGIIGYQWYSLVKRADFWESSNEVEVCSWENHRKNSWDFPARSTFDSRRVCFKIVQATYYDLL